MVLGGEKKIITRLKWNREAENSKTYFCAVSGRFRNENGDSAAFQLRVELKEKVKIGWEFLTLVCFVDAQRGLGVGVETLVWSPGTPKSQRQRQKLRKMMTMSTRINLYLSQQFAAVPCLVWRKLNDWFNLLLPNDHPQSGGWVWGWGGACMVTLLLSKEDATTKFCSGQTNRYRNQQKSSQWLSLMRY